MADFCSQCSYEIFDKDFEDLKGLTAEWQTKQGLFMPVLCEGCGPIQVNHLGECISPDCIKMHGKKEIST